jgi:hypothetical protein
MLAEHSSVSRLLGVVAIAFAAMLMIAMLRPAAHRVHSRAVDDPWAEIRAREAEIQALDVRIGELDSEIARLQPCSIGQLDAEAREREGRREIDLLRAQLAR